MRSVARRGRGCRARLSQAPRSARRPRPCGEAGWYSFPFGVAQRLALRSQAAEVGGMSSRGVRSSWYARASGFAAASGGCRPRLGIAPQAVATQYNMAIDTDAQGPRLRRSEFLGRRSFLR